MKLIRYSLIALLFSGVTVAMAIPARPAVTNLSDIVDRHLSGFHAVDVAGSFDVYITQGPSESVKVKAPDEVMNRIVTEVSGGVLKIYNKNQNFHWGDMFGWHKKIVIYVVISDVDAVILSGSGDVYFKDGLRAAALRLRVSGSGDMSGRIEAKTLESSVSGSGDMTLHGTAGSSSVDLVGSGDYMARDLATQSTSVVVTGSGDAEVNASDKIDAAVHGSGDIRYTGGAHHINSSKSGSGDISRF
jgi:hypothetical protein